MCYGCWMEYGKPEIINEKVSTTASLIEECSEFGGLHIVIDDWNIETNHIQWCIAQGLNDTELECAVALLELTEEERASALALVQGYYGT